MSELIQCKVSENLVRYGDYGPGEVVEVSESEARLQTAQGNLMIIDKETADRLRKQNANKPENILRQQERELKALKAANDERTKLEAQKNKEIEALKAEIEKLKAKGGK